MEASRSIKQTDLYRHRQSTLERRLGLPVTQLPLRNLKYTHPLLGSTSLLPSKAALLKLAAVSHQQSPRAVMKGNKDNGA